MQQANILPMSTNNKKKYSADGIIIIYIYQLNEMFPHTDRGDIIIYIAR